MGEKPTTVDDPAGIPDNRYDTHGLAQGSDRDAPASSKQFTLPRQVWQALPDRVCSVCSKSKLRIEYSKTQFKLPVTTCKPCVERRSEQKRIAEQSTSAEYKKIRRKRYKIKKSKRKNRLP